MKGYPKWFSAQRIHGFIGLFACSGLLLVPTVFELHLEWSIPWRLEAPTRIWVAAVHAGLSFLILWLCGALWPLHMRHGLRIRTNVRSGLLLVGTVGLLGATGLGIYYFGDHGLSKASSLLHTLVGGVMVAAYGWHLIGSRAHLRKTAKPQRQR